MDRPKVSVIIPCFNAAAWLAAAIESGLNQTWRKIEVLVVDDGSTDGSLDVASRFSARGVRIFEQPNRGAAAARNAGLRQATGEYIQYLDADDLLAPDKIEQQLAFAAGCDRNALLSGHWARFTTTPGDRPQSNEPLCYDASPMEWIVRKLTQNAMMHPAAWLCPRHLADRAGPWDERLTLDDDGEYFTRVALLSSGIRCCPKAKSFYRSGLPGSLSGRKSDRAWESAFLSLELSTERLRRACDTTAVRGACATAFQRFIYEAYPAAEAARKRAAARVAELGGTALRPSGGPKFRLICRLFGWRAAKRLQTLRLFSGPSVDR